MLFTVAGASLSLGKRHCYTLSAFAMRQFLIRNMHFPLGFATFLVAVVPQTPATYQALLPDFIIRGATSASAT